MEEIRFSFAVHGMTCSTCAVSVQKALSSTPGVKFVSVNLATEKVFVVGESDLSYDALALGVHNAGYEANRETPTSDQIEKKFASARFDFLLALAITIPLSVGMVFHMIGLWHPPGWTWIELFGATLVLAWPGRKTLWGAWVAVTHAHTNMDTLVSLGAVTAWTTMPLHYFFPSIVSLGAEGAMILAFYLVGRYIEARLKWKATRDLRTLQNLQAVQARVLISDDTVEFVPIEALGVGARVLLQAGDTVPADGPLTVGRVLADESLITGEPMPSVCESGTPLTGGTRIISGEGTMLIDAVGETSFLGRMILLVEAAQSVQIPLQALADRITRYFTPVILTLASIAGLAWFFLSVTEPVSKALLVFVTTVVIACPCALALATPMALLAGTSLAARHGLLLRSGESIQQAGKLDTLILDKTGTLTLGRPSVEENTLPNVWWPVAAALEKTSNHPLAAAVLAYFGDHFPQEPFPHVDNVEELTGSGMFGNWNGRRLALTKPAQPELYKDWMLRGMTVIELHIDGESAGALGIRDPVKPGAKQALAGLRARGLKLVMATGDHETTARTIAAELGLDDVRAGVKPEEKFQLVLELQRAGRVVGMVGDGLNDAAALKQADVGFAMGAGTQVSVESADIVLTTNELGSLSDALDISQITFRQIKRNLFWSFFYNVLVIPAALAGLLHPAAAEIAMTFSSINVLWGSSRIPSQFEKIRRKG